MKGLRSSLSLLSPPPLSPFPSLPLSLLQWGAGLVLAGREPPLESTIAAARDQPSPVLYAPKLATFDAMVKIERCVYNHFFNGMVVNDAYMGDSKERMDICLPHPRPITLSPSRPQILLPPFPCFSYFPL